MKGRNAQGSKSILSQTCGQRPEPRKEELCRYFFTKTELKIYWRIQVVFCTKAELNRYWRIYVVFCAKAKLKIYRRIQVVISSWQWPTCKCNEVERSPGPGRPLLLQLLHSETASETLMTPLAVSCKQISKLVVPSPRSIGSFVILEYIGVISS